MKENTGSIGSVYYALSFKVTLVCTILNIYWSFKVGKFRGGFFFVLFLIYFISWDLGYCVGGIVIFNLLLMDGSEIK